MLVFFFFIMIRRPFFFNDTATTEIFTLSLHDSLPISRDVLNRFPRRSAWSFGFYRSGSCSSLAELGSFSLSARSAARWARSEEHTSELQSQSNLVCRLMLEKRMPSSA